MLLGVTCKRPRPKFSNGCLSILNSLSYLKKLPHLHGSKWRFCHFVIFRNWLVNSLSWCWVSPGTLVYKDPRLNIPTSTVGGRNTYLPTYLYSDYGVYQKNRLRFSDGVFCKLLPGPGAFKKWGVTQGQWPWPRVIRKIRWIKGTFLFEKSVYTPPPVIGSRTKQKK